MSDALKWELAHELGVEGIVATEGWGGVSARNCGNLVKLAIIYAEEAMANDFAARQARAERTRAPVATGYEGRPIYRPSPEGYGAEFETGLAANIGSPDEAFPYWAVEQGPASQELRG